MDKQTPLSEKGIEVPRPRNVLESLNCCIEGIIYAVKHQRHIRYHYAIAVLALLLSLLLDISTTDFILLSLSVVILLFAEMFNTAIEAVVDLVCDRYHILARTAKDIAAGAVLVSSIGVFIMGYVIFSKYLVGPLGLALRMAKEVTGELAIVTLLLVLISVIASKAYMGKGRPLHGGMPSGHSAVAFSLWVSVTLLTMNPLVAILSFIMAIMVSHSRLIGGIHTMKEVVLGALLGAGLTFLVFYLSSSW
ncbi:MAG: diacylglycerol kinase [Deltaproteobacteria bacterium]|nr:diacylglycerol kinase [Deltaproteobacteria bacterium]